MVNKGDNIVRVKKGRQEWMEYMEKKGVKGMVNKVDLLPDDIKSRVVDWLIKGMSFQGIVNKLYEYPEDVLPRVGIPSRQSIMNYKHKRLGAHLESVKDLKTLSVNRYQLKILKDSVEEKIKKLQREDHPVLGLYEQAQRLEKKLKMQYKKIGDLSIMPPVLLKWEEQLGLTYVRIYTILNDGSFAENLLVNFNIDVGKRSMDTATTPEDIGKSIGRFMRAVNSQRDRKPVEAEEVDTRSANGTVPNSKTIRSRELEDRL